MLIPTVIPIIEDELINGWLERLANANNIPLGIFVKNYLDIPYVLTTGKSKQLKYVGGLSKITSHPSLCGMNPKAILIKNTPLPVEALFMDVHSGSVYIDGMFNNPYYFDKLKKARFMNYLLNGPRFCPMCVEADIRKHGFPIIHVLHQYASVTACWKHGIELTGTIDDKTCSPAPPEEIKLSLFLKNIYDSGYIGDITDIQAVCLKEPVINKIKALIKALRDKDKYLDIKKFSGINSETEFKNALFPNVLNPMKRDNLIRAFSQIVDPEELIIALQESVRMKTYDYTNALNGTAIDFVSTDHPFVTLHCRKCKRDYTTYYHEILLGPECPFCANNLFDENRESSILEIMFRRLARRDRFICIENDNEPLRNLKKMRHLCGKDVYVQPRNMLSKGSILCPKCNPAMKPYKFHRRQFIDAIDRIGIRRKMTCGLWAEIITYRGANDIDVRFENGIICKHVNYFHFIKGSVSPVPFSGYAALRIGEKRVMHCGLWAEIIAYRGTNNLDVRFENSVIRKHVTYNNFIKGLLSPVPFSEYAALRIGERRMMTCGLWAEIIAYRGANDIDVRFENDTIRKNVSYSNFRKGSVSPVPFSEYAALEKEE